eukprot:GHVT01065353.1.p1 GENE.GHVT01065353.1~~GHVT01065353.1.p1  ORF type:complete len:310 (+),score=13.86 GHVT01065353.1:433-1362(+)
MARSLGRVQTRRAQDPASLPAEDQSVRTNAWATEQLHRLGGGVTGDDAPHQPSAFGEYHASESGTSKRTRETARPAGSCARQLSTEQEGRGWNAVQCSPPIWKTDGRMTGPNYEGRPGEALQYPGPGEALQHSGSAPIGLRSGPNYEGGLGEALQYPGPGEALPHSGSALIGPRRGVGYEGRPGEALQYPGPGEALQYSGGVPTARSQGYDGGAPAPSVAGSRRIDGPGLDMKATPTGGANSGLKAAAKPIRALDHREVDELLGEDGVPRQAGDDAPRGPRQARGGTQPRVDWTGLCYQCGESGHFVRQ